jgi:hypothetical protein
LLDSNFEHVAGLGAFNENWPRENMAARSFVGYFLVDVAGGLFNIFRLDTGAFESGRTGGDQRLNLDGITGLDAHHRRRAGVVITPGNGFGCGLELEGLLGVN